MRRRRGMAGADQALELFLDALCNAFGGIIFISLLVCVMLQLSGKSAEPEPVDKVEQARRQMELTRLENENAKLEQLIESQERQLAGMVQTDDAELQEQFIKLTQEEGALGEERVVPMPASSPVLQRRRLLPAERPRRWESH